jgi:hypothetical protein
MSYYGTLAKAATYFEARLHRELWNNTSNSNQEKALQSATDRIDRLAFIYAKTESDQINAFPRTPAPTASCPNPTAITEVPEAIEHACYEIAFELLNGADPEKEVRELQYSSFAFANLRKGYDRESVPEHLNAGIPSALAWGYLKPYLRNPLDYKINRA